MACHYMKNGRLYSFYIDPAGKGWKEYIRIVSGTRVVYVPVKECSDFRVKINKKSISAAGGSAALFSFISNCIREDFMTVYIDKIIKTFF